MSTETTVATAVDVASWMQEVASAVEAEATHLTQLDSAIGDGDHGVNMTRGFRAVVEAVDGSGPPGKQLITAGKTLVSKVGGASGPLWGTALRRAGRSLGDAPALDGAALVTALDAALAGVVELGAAEPGDKTMVDALGPAVAALRARVEDGETSGEAIAAAAAAAPRRAPARRCRCRPARAAPPTSASAPSATRTRARRPRR